MSPPSIFTILKSADMPKAGLRLRVNEVYQPTTFLSNPYPIYTRQLTENAVSLKITTTCYPGYS